jgi:hypothetical protein
LFTLRCRCRRATPDTRSPRLPIAAIATPPRRDAAIFTLFQFSMPLIFSFRFSFFRFSSPCLIFLRYYLMLIFIIFSYAFMPLIIFAFRLFQMPPDFACRRRFC